MPSNHTSLLQNIVSFTGLFCQKRPIILRSLLIEDADFRDISYCMEYGVVYTTDIDLTFETFIMAVCSIG